MKNFLQTTEKSKKTAVLGLLALMAAMAAASCSKADAETEDVQLKAHAANGAQLADASTTSGAHAHQDGIPLLEKGGEITFAKRVEGERDLSGMEMADSSNSNGDEDSEDDASDETTVWNNAFFGRGYKINKARPKDVHPPVKYLEARELAPVDIEMFNRLFPINEKVLDESIEKYKDDFASALSAIYNESLLVDDYAIYSDEVLASYEDMIARQPGDDLYQRLMQMYIQKKLFDKSDALYKEWVAFNPAPNYQREYLNWRSMILNGETEKAFEAFPALYAKCDSDSDKEMLFLMLADLGMNNDKLAAKHAKKILDIIREDSKSNFSGSLARAVFAIVANDGKELGKAMRVIVKEDPKIQRDSNVVVNFALMKNPKLLDGFFTDPKIKLDGPWNVFAIVYSMKTGDENLAYKKLLKFVDESETTQPDMIREITVLSGKLNRPKSEIEGVYEKIYARAKDPLLQSNWAKLFSLFELNMGNDEGALKWLARIGDSFNQFDRYYGETTIYLKMKNGKAAKASFDKLEKLSIPRNHPVTEDFLEELKIHVLMLDDPKEAIVQIKKRYADLVKKKDHNPEEATDLLYKEALIYSDLLGDYEKSVEILKEVAKTKNDAEILNALGYTQLFIDSEVQDGIENIKKALILSPDSPEIIDSYGFAMLKLGKYNDALTNFEKADKKMKHASIKSHLAEALYLTGKKTQARKVMKEALALDGTDLETMRIAKKYFPDLYEEYLANTKAKESGANPAKTGKDDGKGQDNGQNSSGLKSGKGGFSAFA